MPEDEDHDHLFVLHNGKEFPHGTLGRRISIIFGRAGITLKDGRITSTGIRKAFATMAFGLQKTKKRVVNRHMSHHENTAEANYVAAYSAARASQAHTIISGIINNPYAVPETSTVPSDTETEEDQEEVPRFQPKRGVSDEVYTQDVKAC